jgi:hypothetical protein
MRSARPCRPAWLAILGVSVGACYESRRIIFVGEDPAADAGVVAGNVETIPGRLTPSPAADDLGVAASADGTGDGTRESALGGAAANADAGAPRSAVVSGIAPGALAPCGLPSTTEAGAVLFSGALAGSACRINLDAPYETFWYPYQDSEGASTVQQGATAPGCEPSTCALHAAGPTPGNVGYSQYGAGVGFPLAAADAPLDISRFAGIQFWARGTASGTRGPSGSAAPRTLFVKVVTVKTRLGDDFGAYCTIDSSAWTPCRSEFAALRRDGYVADPDPASDVLDLASATRVEFEFRLHRDPAGNIPAPVSFDVELAAISFF